MPLVVVFLFVFFATDIKMAFKKKKSNSSTCCFAGDQSVQSQVQPEYQHDQEVHRGAHRQAVHRAEPDLGGRVQLRGLGLSGGGRGEALTPARPAGADGREAVAALSGSCGLKKIK